MHENTNETKEPIAAPPMPPPDPVLEAIRIELRALVETPQLGPKTLNRLAQISVAAANYCAARNPREKVGRRRRGGGIIYPSGVSTYSMGEDLAEGTNGGYAPEPEGTNVGYDAPEPGMAMNNETFGARMIRELVTTLPEILVAHRDTPAALVAAIADARRNGMIDVAKLMEERLGIKLEAAAVRPVTAVSPDAQMTTEAIVAGLAGVSAGAKAVEDGVQSLLTQGDGA